MFVIGSQGWLEVGDPDDCTSLEVRVEARDRDELDQMLKASGLGHWDGSDHVTLYVGELRRQARFGGVGPDWPRRWDEMIAYAGRKGWLTEDGHGVLAHLTSSAPAPSRPTSPSRRRAARLLREFADAFLAREYADPALDLMSATLQIPLGTLTEAPLRSTTERHHHFDESFISGDASPVGVAARLSRDGDDVVLLVRVPRAFEGRSGHVHRGLVCAAFEDAFTLVMGTVHEEHAETATLETDFLHPLPVEHDLEIRARLTGGADGRFQVEGEASVDGIVCARGRAVMVSGPTRDAV